MSEKIERLESLVLLAREPSGDKRRELLREVTDLFLEQPEKLSGAEVDHFSGIMGKVAYELEMEVRMDLAERLAKANAAPPDLIKRLANDQIEVAGPILTESGVLRNSDLIDIVKRHSHEHHMAISVRNSVSEDVADMLVDKGSDEVLVSLARNDGAILSRRAMEVMTRRSELVEELQEPLIMREDVPADLKHQMFLHVSKALRQHIMLSIENLDESEVDRLLEETRDKIEGQGDESAMSPAEKFIDRKDRLKQLSPTLLVQLLRQGKIAEFVAGIARLARMDLQMAHRITFDDGGETLAVVCKAIGIDRTTFSDLLLLTNVDSSRSREDRDALLGVYTRITPEAAQRAMRFWRTRKQMLSTSGGGV